MFQSKKDYRTPIRPDRIPANRSFIRSQFQLMPTPILVLSFPYHGTKLPAAVVFDLLTDAGLCSCSCSGYHVLHDLDDRFV